jgi:hypothetical protein
LSALDDLSKKQIINALCIWFQGFFWKFCTSIDG